MKKTVYVLYLDECKHYFVDWGVNTGKPKKARHFNTEYDAAKFLDTSGYNSTGSNWVVLPYKIKDNTPIDTNTEDVNDLITNMRQEIVDLETKIWQKNSIIDKLRASKERYKDRCVCYKRSVNESYGLGTDRITQLEESNKMLSTMCNDYIKENKELKLFRSKYNMLVNAIEDLINNKTDDK